MRRSSSSRGGQSSRASPAATLPEGAFHIDILTRLGELFDFQSLSTQRVELDGVEVSVVTPEMLYRMKKNTIRPKDWADAARLAHRFGLKEA